MESTNFEIEEGLDFFCPEEYKMCDCAQKFIEDLNLCYITSLIVSDSSLTTNKVKNSEHPCYLMC